MEQKILHHLGCRKMLVLYFRIKTFLGHPKWLAGFFSINTNGEFVWSLQEAILQHPSIGTRGPGVCGARRSLRKKQGSFRLEPQKIPNTWLNFGSSTSFVVDLCTMKSCFDSFALSVEPIPSCVCQICATFKSLDSHCFLPWNHFHWTFSGFWEFVKKSPFLWRLTDLNVFEDNPSSWKWVDFLRIGTQISRRSTSRGTQLKPLSTGVIKLPAIEMYDNLGDFL